MSLQLNGETRLFPIDDDPIGAAPHSPDIRGGLSGGWATGHLEAVNPALTNRPYSRHW